jgi:class 3 adenylate cyclase/dienelactone hydrolase
LARSDAPKTRYAKSGDVNIAYQVIGDGARDLVYVPGWISNVERGWDEPGYARFLNRLASFSRLILFDKRGTGLSDRVPEHELPTLEQRMDDVRAVMDAAASERAALFGVSEGGPMCILSAATHPDRASAVVVYGSYARRATAADYPWGRTPAQQAEFMRAIDEDWGGPVALAERAPSRMDDAAFVDWWSMYLRQSASPSAVRTLTEMNYEVDVRHVLASVHVPALILHRRGDRVMHVEEARFIAERIDGAKLVLFDGDDHLPWVGDQNAVLDEIEGFLTGVRRGPEPDRVLATVLFVDLVSSTERAAEVGDRRWRDLLDAFHQRARDELNRFRGTLVDTTGDGFLATFDGPARGVRCAHAVLDAVRAMALEARAGLHTGEIEMAGTDIRGIAVHLAARVMSTAEPGEVRVSSTVRDLVAGSGITFHERGEHSLKGVPGTWRLFSAA